MTSTLSPDIVRQLAPNGVLRAGINLSNFLLVTGQGPAGEPQGVAPDMAKAIADRLNVPLQLVPFQGPGLLADAADQDVWDIGLIGAEPARAEKMDFTRAYVEIEATYLVPPGSTLSKAAEVDRPGTRIAVSERTAYDLWLVRNIQHATLVHAQGFEAAFNLFIDQKLDALASLKPALLGDVKKMPGFRILEGRFTAIQQSVGTRKNSPRSLAFLESFVRDSVASGFVAELIERHQVQGLTVAPL